MDRYFNDDQPICQAGGFFENEIWVDETSLVGESHTFVDDYSTCLEEVADYTFG
ncbi:MAG: hypothetical protein MJZ23_08940 [Paludibacteraceae bacterium]|nr:hypothetical protein [Paludibacteraceae bacterium]